MSLELAKKQITARPGVTTLKADAVAERLKAFTGYNGDAQALNDMPIIGVLASEVFVTESEFQGRKVTTVYIPVLVWNAKTSKTESKITSLGALARSTKESVEELGAGFAQTAQYANDGEFIQLLANHVGAGDPNATALPAKHIALKSVVLEREFDGRKAKQKFHHLTLVG